MWTGSGSYAGGIAASPTYKYNISNATICYRHTYGQGDAQPACAEVLEDAQLAPLRARRHAARPPSLRGPAGVVHDEARVAHNSR